MSSTSADVIVYLHKENSDHADLIYGFNLDTKISEVNKYVSVKCGINSFHLETKDGDGQMVHVDYEYIRSVYQNQIDRSGVQPKGSKTPEIHLYIKETSSKEICISILISFLLLNVNRR